MFRLAEIVDAKRAERSVYDFGSSHAEPSRSRSSLACNGRSEDVALAADRRDEGRLGRIRLGLAAQARDVDAISRRAPG